MVLTGEAFRGCLGLSRGGVDGVGRSRAGRRGVVSCADGRDRGLRRGVCSCSP